MKRTPLMQACIKNSPEMVRTLLEARASVNGHDGSGNSAVYYALLKQNMEIVSMLRGAGLDEAQLARWSFMMGPEVTSKGRRAVAGGRCRKVKRLRRWPAALAAAERGDVPKARRVRRPGAEQSGSRRRQGLDFS